MPALPNERQYRACAAALKPTQRSKRIETDYYVEGYASTFDDLYELYRDWDGNVYSEIVAPDAFRHADMTDVIFQYDHAGDVFARMSNGTLIVEPDEHGLFIAADLGLTTKSREMYEQISTGLITCMSWAFDVDGMDYNNDTRTQTITSVRKVYDVSAVSLPADPNTEISARNLLLTVDGAIAARVREESAKRRRAVMRAKAAIAINKGVRNG